MLPSFVSNLFWGEEDKNDDDVTIVNHTLSEAPGDWLIIDCSTGETIDNESICSEASDHSWIVAPPPRFRAPSTNSSSHHHSMEDLLIEHPTMSVYAQQCQPLGQEPKNPLEQTQDPSRMQVAIRNQNRQIVLYHTHARRQIAAQLGIPLQTPSIQQEQIEASATKPKADKKQFNKKNTNFIRVNRGKKSFKIHHCGVKAGRRRC